MRGKKEKNEEREREWVCVHVCVREREVVRCWREIDAKDILDFSQVLFSNISFLTTSKAIFGPFEELLFDSDREKNLWNILDWNKK